MLTVTEQCVIYGICVCVCWCTGIFSVAAAKFDFNSEPSSELNTITPRRVSGQFVMPNELLILSMSLSFYLVDLHHRAYILLSLFSEWDYADHCGRILVNVLAAEGLINNRIDFEVI